MSDFEPLLKRAETLLDRLESILPEAQAPVNWQAWAWRWVRSQSTGYLSALTQLDPIQLSDLHGIEQQKATLLQNTQQFVAGFPANHVLLAGARGTGKSSLVKAVFNSLREDGLRLIEVDKTDLVDLLQITSQLNQRPERFIIYCDDLSFEAGDPAYKALKVVLDGSVEVASDNILVYATSNRRNLVPELMADNLASVESSEVRPNDAIEEKTALSERFGLRLMFHPCDQDDYLAIAEQWVKFYGGGAFDSAARVAALQWSYSRGARSGRTANQFARDYVGRLKWAEQQSRLK